MRNGGRIPTKENGDDSTGFARAFGRKSAFKERAYQYNDPRAKN
jgi:hypothetical protein